MPKLFPPRRLTWIGCSGVAFGLVLWGFARPHPPTPGQLLTPQTEVVWRSAPHREAQIKQQARAEFPLTNVGGTDVRITGIESGCGCTKPNVEPEVIRPGATGTLTAIGTPLTSGQRDVVITVRTDSPLTPEVRFTLTMINDRIPPFITAVAGDLNFVEASELVRPREVVVTTIEDGPQGLMPSIQSDLPLLDFGKPVVGESPYGATGLHQRAYRYAARFRESLPPGSFSGRVWATDPWTKLRDKGLIVSYQPKEELRAIPDALTLRVEKDGKPAAQDFAVIAQRDQSTLTVRVEGPHADGVRVTEDAATRGRRFRRYHIEADAKLGGESRSATVVIRPEDGSATAIRVPVVVLGASS